MCFIKHLYSLSWSLLFQLYVNSLNQLDPRKPGLTRLHSLWLSSHKAELPSVLSIHYPIWRSVTDNKLAIPSGPTASFILAITGFWGATFFLKKQSSFLTPHAITILDDIWPLIGNRPTSRSQQNEDGIGKKMPNRKRKKDQTTCADAKWRKRCWLFHGPTLFFFFFF